MASLFAFGRNRWPGAVMGFLVIVAPLVLLACVVVLAWLRSRRDQKNYATLEYSQVAEGKSAENRFISPNARESLERRRATTSVRMSQTKTSLSPPGWAENAGRGGTDDQKDRGELKAACVAALEAAAIEHPAGHGKHFARYILRSAAGERIEMMFEKGDASAANLWLASRHSGDLTAMDIEYRHYSASALYQADGGRGQKAYGRHSALKSMRDLAHADLFRFTIARLAQMETILAKLATAGQTN